MNNILDSSQLDFEGDFDRQVEGILKCIRLNKTEVERLQILFDELRNIFESCWKGSRIDVFGSILTGLAIKTSDVDIYVHLPPWYNQSSATFVKQAASMLRSIGNFTKITAITRAKVPIVQFYHKPTQRHCDVSFSGPMGLKNSKWLEYMISLDERILPLALIVKYWSKVHSFTGTNLMSNYCLTLLLMFYLQQKHIVPPTILLQQQIDMDLVDNWNMAFVKINYNTTNKESLYELLGGFFKYYSDLRFDTYILSLYTGELIERTKFFDLRNLPKEYELYFNNVNNKFCTQFPLKDMCVQDPFNHTRNVGVAVHFKLFTKIMNHFKKAATIFDQEHKNDFLRYLLHTDEPPLPLTVRPGFTNVHKNHGIKKNYKNWNPRYKKFNDKNFKRKFNNFKDSHFMTR